MPTTAPNPLAAKSAQFADRPGLAVCSASKAPPNATSATEEITPVTWLRYRLEASATAQRSPRKKNARKCPALSEAARGSPVDRTRCSQCAESVAIQDWGARVMAPSMTTPSPAIDHHRRVELIRSKIITSGENGTQSVYSGLGSRALSCRILRPASTAEGRRIVKTAVQPGLPVSIRRLRCYAPYLSSAQEGPRTPSTTRTFTCSSRERSPTRWVTAETKVTTRYVLGGSVAAGGIRKS
jgi:hypothetical protein